MLYLQNQKIMMPSFKIEIRDTDERKLKKAAVDIQKVLNRRGIINFTIISGETFKEVNGDK